MSGFNRQHLGSVTIRSGKLVILDPRSMSTLSPKDVEDAAARAAMTEERGAEILGAAAVALETPFPNQKAEVFATYNLDGEITRIEIDLEQE